MGSLFRSLLQLRPFFQFWYLSELKRSFRYSLLGPIWLVIQPIVIVGFFWIAMDAQILNRPFTHETEPLYWGLRLALWTIFTTAWSRIGALYKNYRDLLFIKPLDPRVFSFYETLKLLFSVFAFGIPSLIVVNLFFNLPATNSLLGFSMALIPALLSGSALGMLSSSACGLIPDLERVVPYFQWALFSATPILYTTPSHESVLRSVNLINPFTGIFDLATQGGMGLGSFAWTSFLHLLLWSFLFWMLASHISKTTHLSVVERLP